MTNSFVCEIVKNSVDSKTQNRLPNETWSSSNILEHFNSFWDCQSTLCSWVGVQTLGTSFKRLLCLDNSPNVSETWKPCILWDSKSPLCSWVGVPPFVNWNHSQNTAVVFKFQRILELLCQTLKPLVIPRFFTDLCTLAKNKKSRFLLNPNVPLFKS